MERQRPVTFSRRTFLKGITALGVVSGIGGMFYGNAEIMNASLSPDQIDSLQDNGVYTTPKYTAEERRTHKEIGEVVSFASLILTLFSLVANIQVSSDRKVS